MACLATPLRHIALSTRELNLTTVCSSGQSFRWHRFPTSVTLPDSTPLPAPSNKVEELPVADTEEWAFGWKDRTVVLRQDASGLHYRSLYPLHPPYDAFTDDLAQDTTLAWIKRYFQLDTPLEPLYDDWAAGDPKFRRKVESAGEGLRGIRVLKQGEWETLVSFICSANNNIGRITLMVNRLCASLGNPLPHPSSFTPTCVHSSPATLPSTSLPTPLPVGASPSTLPSLSAPPPPTPLDAPAPPSFYSFPPPSSLIAPTTEPLLRQLGFGYRASFIPSTAATLLDSSAAAGVEPEAFLRGLKKDEFVKAGKGGIAEARAELLKFKGVGRKVADCVLLFGLGWTSTVPVDTHVFQIAIRDYSFPSTKSTSLTPLLHDKVASFLASRWGPYAGWAQQVLFFADLAKPSSSSPSKKTVYVKEELKLEIEEEREEGERKRKLTFEEEVAALIATPGQKRSRRTVVQKTTTRVKVEIKEEDAGEESDGSSVLSSPPSSPERKQKKGRERVKQEE